MVTPILTVDFRTEYDNVNDSIRNTSRACIDIKAVQSGLIKEIGANRFGVLLAILSYMDKDGRAFPSQRKLAEMTGQSVNTVNKLINELLETEVAGQYILRREMIGTGFRKKSMYYIHTGEITNTEAPLKDPTNGKLTAKEAVEYFAELYEEEFGQGYVINWGRELSQVKNKLLSAYDDETVIQVIEVAIKRYRTDWASPNYPLPTVSMLCSWIANRAYGLLQQEQEGRAKQAERISTAGDLDDTDKALNLL